MDNSGSFCYLIHLKLVIITARLFLITEAQFWSNSLFGTWNLLLNFKQFLVIVKKFVIWSTFAVLELFRPDKVVKQKQRPNLQDWKSHKRTDWRKDKYSFSLIEFQT